MQRYMLRSIFCSIIVLFSMQAVAGKHSCPEPKNAVSSPAFSNGGRIPAKFTCQGSNISPQLFFGCLPHHTCSLVLIVDDPDAPAPFPNPFVHWVVYDLPAIKTLPENVDIAALFSCAREGINNFGNIGYDGPCPPVGNGVHHYNFNVYALNIRSLGLAPGATKEQVVNAMRGHILRRGLLIGTYIIP